MMLIIFGFNDTNFEMFLDGTQLEIRYRKYGALFNLSVCTGRGELNLPIKTKIKSCSVPFAREFFLHKCDMKLVLWLGLISSSL